MYHFVIITDIVDIIIGTNFQICMTFSLKVFKIYLKMAQTRIRQCKKLAIDFPIAITQIYM